MEFIKSLFISKPKEVNHDYINQRAIQKIYEHNYGCIATYNDIVYYNKDTDSYKSIKENKDYMFEMPKYLSDNYPELMRNY